jgi:hypothetical protein
LLAYLVDPSFTLLFWRMGSMSYFVNPSLLHHLQQSIASWGPI